MICGNLKILKLKNFKMMYIKKIQNMLESPIKYYIQNKN